MNRHILREAAAVAVEDLEIGFVEIRPAERIVGAGVAAYAQPRVFEIHRPFDRQLAGFFIVRDRIRPDSTRVLTNLHVSGQYGEAFGIERCGVAVDPNAVIAVGNGCCRRRFVFGRRGTHISGVDHAGCQERKKNSQCGSNMRSHGQSESP
jgi:hypothetical protein